MSSNVKYKEDTILNSKIKGLLHEMGPSSGAWLSEKFPDEHPIKLWRACYLSDDILIQNCARYYLRYDIMRENLLRLSPSILRDFLTFSLLYLPEQRLAAIEAGTLMANEFRKISLRKLSFARAALLRLSPSLQDEIMQSCAVFLSGDIAYYLAHATPRVHSTMGVTILGSDIDLIIVHNLEAAPNKLQQIQDELLKIKALYLASKDIGEELDFIVKPVSRMLNQLSYSDIHQKIASKILYESVFLMGRLDIYQSLLANLEISGAKEKIETDFDIALTERKETIRKILSLSHVQITKEKEVNSLFYASQERLEFT